jgi:RNA-splicing ligase RtcB
MAALAVAYYCGMRLVLTDLTYDEVKPHLRQLVDKLFERVPAGVGSTGFLKISQRELLVRVDKIIAFSHASHSDVEE